VINMRAIEDRLVDVARKELSDAEGAKGIYTPRVIALGQYGGIIAEVRRTRHGCNGPLAVVARVNL
jgi:hypothetical protein